MCLLLKQPAGHVFTEVELADFYSYNPDGIGVMWATDNTINVVKLVPKNLQDIIEFYKENAAGKECSIHFRWRTHGDTDLENCHPYQVFGEDDGYPLFLMHNGVLHTGNAWDTTKSDTWHFIENIIKPALKSDPTQFMSEWFQTLIEGFIGDNNKFVMMDAYGNTVTFNEASGVVVGEVWYSNTYAWTAPMKPVFKRWHHDAEDYKYPYDKYTPAAFDEAPRPSLAAYDDDDYEAHEFAYDFFDALNYMEMDSAYAELSIDAITNYYLDYTTSAIRTLKDLEMGLISETEVFEMFSLPPQNLYADEHLQVGMQ